MLGCKVIPLTVYNKFSLDNFVGIIGRMHCIIKSGCAYACPTFSQTFTRRKPEAGGPISTIMWKKNFYGRCIYVYFIDAVFVERDVYIPGPGCSN